MRPWLKLTRTLSPRSASKLSRFLALSAGLICLFGGLSLWQISHSLSKPLAASRPAQAVKLTRQLSPSDAARPSSKPQPALQGQAAIAYLKQQGLYHSLREAVAASTYEIAWEPRPSSPKLGSAYQAANPEQQLSAYFTPTEVRVVTQVADKLTAASRQLQAWQVGMKLRGYGYGQQLLSLAPGIIKTTGNRIEIQKAALRGPQASITEWYVNGPAGIEQGFTIPSAPGPKFGQTPLRVALEVTGDVQARLVEEGQAIILARAHGQEVLRYDHLHAFDALGRSLPSHLELAENEVSLVVDDTAALYPVTIDPLVTQVAKLTANDGATGDQFGQAVAISGDTVVIGAFVKNSFTGAAYIFARNQGGTENWGLVKKLTASDGVAGDQFGGSVAISDQTVVVGANLKNSLTGAAYIFVRNAGGADNWGEVKKLTASDGVAGDRFGGSVAISGDTVVAGMFSNNVLSTGAAYIFARNQGGADNWGQVKKLTASDSVAGDQFGFSVAISGDTIVAGARNKNSGTGAAYIFARNAGGADNWGEVKKLTASNAAAGDFFSVSVAISNDTVAVGAAGNNSVTGAAYIFARNAGGADNWGEVKKLTTSDGPTPGQFGQSVAISGETAVVGAPRNNSLTGAAYIFARNAGGADNWGEVKKLTASDGVADDIFGFSVAISDDTVVVGARGKDSFKGAAYVFIPVANLTLVKTASPSPVTTGTNITYTITVTNNGPDPAESVTLTDNLPASTAFVSCAATGSGVCGGTGNNQTVTFASLAPGASETITLVATVSCSLANNVTISNTATVSSITFDPDLTNNTRTATTTTFNPPPVITCPANITAVTAKPGDGSVGVNFVLPVATDNCPGTVVVASPPSGSKFPVGTTVVTITATDSGGGTATCSFKVTVWDVAIQDDRRGDILYINSFTGDYLYIQCGTTITFSGKGKFTLKGCKTTFKDDSRVTAIFDRCPQATPNLGSASIKHLPSGPTFFLNDSNILNHASKCK